MITAELQYELEYPNGANVIEQPVSPWAPRDWKRNPALNYGLSLILCTLIALYFLATGERTQHWSILPLFMCGVLTGIDIIRWLRGEIDVFDLKFFVSSFLFLNCFLAPLMHLGYDAYGLNLDMPDWPRWFGYMGFLNLGGIVVFKISQRYFFRITKPVRRYWQVDSGRIFATGGPAIAMSVLALAIIHLFFGGLIKTAGGTQIAAGAGAYLHLVSVLRMLGDPLVPLAMMLAICWLHINRPERIGSNLTVMILLAATFVLQFLAVGLRGSRSVIMFAVFVVTMLIHFMVRPMSKKWIFVGLAVMVVFLYLYGFRKRMGLEGLRAFYDPQARQSYGYEMGGRGLHLTIMGDLARADEQALMLYNLTENRGSIDYEYLKGKTYAMSILTFVPRAIWPNKPDMIKNRAGAVLLHGSDVMGDSSRVYGLAGEAMMNFGPFAVVPAFLVYGAVLGFFRKKILTLYESDSRLFLVPILTLVLMMMAVMSDSDNWMFLLLLTGTLPFFVFFFGSTKISVDDYLSMNNQPDVY